MKQVLPPIVATYDELLEMAKQEPVKQKLNKWRLLAPTIIELHDNKNFSYQEIADWLILHKGIKASASSVYQSYRRHKDA